jgi:predicted transcriptional regulator of viral defense system
MANSLSLAKSLVRKHGTVRSRELVAAGLARAQVSRLVASGKMQRVARGLYALPARLPESQEGIMVVARRAPNVTFCLLTALRIHELTTQAPFEVWIAIGNKQRAPRLEWPRLRVLRYSGAALEYGVELRKLGGVQVRVTSIAKTVADCFKFRQTVGLDVALEALKETLAKRYATVDELWRAAQVCRVTRIMRPYIEALT